MVGPLIWLAHGWKKGSLLSTIRRAPGRRGSQSIALPGAATVTRMNQMGPMDSLW